MGVIATIRPWRVALGFMLGGVCALLIMCATIKRLVQNLDLEKAPQCCARPERCVPAQLRLFCIPKTRGLLRNGSIQRSSRFLQQDGQHSGGERRLAQAGQESPLRSSARTRASGTPIGATAVSLGWSTTTASRPIAASWTSFSASVASSAR